MPSTIQLTLEELTQIALGTEELKLENLNILHNIIFILLKKLNCQDEKITVQGMRSTSLKCLLKKSTTLFPLDIENVEILANRMDKIDEQEKRIDDLQKKLYDLTRYVKLSERDDDKEFNLNLDYWEKYDEMCESTYVDCDDESVLHCKLLKNTEFMKKLVRRIADPMVHRIFQYEIKIEALHKELISFMKMAMERFKELEVLDRCVIEIEKLRETIEENYMKFLGTMEEIQEMFDAKLDKFHLPALKKYIENRFLAIEARLTEAERVRDCPSAVGFITDVKCISCGTENATANVCAHANVMPGVRPPKKKVSQKWCGCKKSVEQLSVNQRIVNLNINDVRNRFERDSFRASTVDLESGINSPTSSYYPPLKKSISMLSKM